MTSFLLASPRTQPVTVDEARAFCGAIGPEYDCVLGMHIMLATRQVEQDTERALITQKWQVVFDAWPEDLQIKLPFAPVSAVVTRYYPLGGEDGWCRPTRAQPYVPQAIDGERGVVTFSETCHRIALRPFHAIEINFVVGYGPKPRDVPDDLRVAVLLQVKHRFSITNGPGPDLPPAYSNLTSRHRRHA